MSRVRTHGARWPSGRDREASRILVWFPEPSVMRMRGRGKKGLGNNYTLTRAKAGI